MIQWKSQWNAVHLFLIMSMDCIISLNRGGLYIESPKWINDKNATVNQQNNNHKCFPYVKVALNHESI